jgi:hypothetical protein
MRNGRGVDGDAGCAIGGIEPARNAAAGVNRST